MAQFQIRQTNGTAIYATLSGAISVSDAGVVTLSGSPSFTSITVTGTAGSGYYEVAAQSSAPSSPTSGAIRIYSDTSGRFAYRDASGFIVSLAVTAATAVTLPTTGTLSTLAGSETLSSKTLTAPKFANAGFIADANGNEEIIFTTTASAVNELTFANAATGNPVTLTASGGDTNVSLKLVGKGTGGIIIPDGAIATPGLQLAGATNTGIYRATAFSNMGMLVSNGINVCQWRDDGANSYFGPSASPFRRSDSTGAMAWALQAFSGATCTIEIGDAAAYFAVQSAATPSAAPFQVLNSGGTVQASVSTAFDIVANTGGLVCSTVGKGITVKSGTGARAGNATLTAGTVTVTNTTVTANTIIVLSRKTAGGTLGAGGYSYTLSAGASFTITAVDLAGVLSALDTSVISYWLIETN